MAFPDLLQRGRVEVHPGLERVERRRAQIRQPDRAGPDQHDAALYPFAQSVPRGRVQHPPGRDHALRCRPGVVQPEAARLVKRKLGLADPHGVAGQDATHPLRPDSDRALALGDAQRLQSERGHEPARELREHGQTAHHLVAPGRDGKAAMPRRRFLKNRKVGHGAREAGQGRRRVATDGREARSASGPGAIGDQQQTKSGDDATPRECRRQHPVAVRRASVRFGEHDIKRDAGGPQILQGSNQGGHRGARPRPLAVPRKAFVVDGDNTHARRSGVRVRRCALERVESGEPQALEGIGHENACRQQRSERQQARDGQ
jgi:hypothetical protein